MNALLNDFLFSLNATMPVFVLIIIGFGLRKIKLFDDNMSLKLSQFAFKVLLPVLLFNDLSTSDFISIWDGRLVFFCFGATIVSIAIAAAVSKLHHNKDERGEIIQASYRSSAAILGIAFVNNIYGTAHSAALMIIGTVPLYNIMAVTILSVTSPNREKNISTGKLIKRTAINVLKNPIIIGIALGIVWSFLSIPQPVIISRSLSYLGNMATPLSLISLGALFKVEDAKPKIKISLFITFMKLVFFTAIFLNFAMLLGFRGEKLVAILVMLGSATTGSCFVMAKNLGHNGTVTSCAVMLTTFFSSFTLTLWLFLIKVLDMV